MNVLMMMMSDDDDDDEWCVVELIVSEDVRCIDEIVLRLNEYE